MSVANVTHPSGTRAISQLPPELFVKILKEVNLLPEDSDPSLVGYWGCHTDWTSPFQLVCRYWRDTICSTPQLWQEVTVSRNPEWLELCLSRCAGTLASVHIMDAHSPKATFATLRRHASCIKACHVISDRDSLLDLSSFLDTRMPALETLSLRHTPFEAAPDVSFALDRFPCLSTLSLVNWSAPRDSAAFTSLRSLTLMDTPWPFSYDHFLDVMENTHNLEHLELDLNILDDHPDIRANLLEHHSSRNTPVILPRLKDVTIRGPPELVFDLFSWIYAPQATTIKVGSNAIYSADEDSDPLAAHVLIPIKQLGYSFLRTPSSVFIRCRDGMLELRLRSGVGSLVCSLEHEILMEETWPTAHLGQNLIAIMDVFSVVSVDTLEVEGRPDRVTADTWQRVFQGFRSLRRLHVHGRGTPDNLWRGLELATAAAMEHDGVVCCPLLSEVTTYVGPDTGSEFHAPAKLFEAMYQALRARAEHYSDGRALQKLRLHMSPAKELYGHAVELREGLVEDVRALVEELEYREYPPT